jgi:hypothetical protein
LFTIERLQEIWSAVESGDDFPQGGFLVAFGGAFVRADQQNAQILKDAAVMLVRKYGLEDYGRNGSNGSKDEA